MLAGDPNKNSNIPPYIPASAGIPHMKQSVPINTSAPAAHLACLWYV